MGRQALLNRVVEFYHHTLLNAPEAVAYLEKRRLNHPELVAQFRLGFANRTLAYRLPIKQVQAGAKIRARLKDAGIMRETGHEHFTGSLVVPVIDLNGQIREMYGRKITSGLRSGTPLHLYLPGAHGGVWNEAALQASQVVILCESLIDAMSLWVAGHRNVTTAYGVNGFTAAHVQALQQYGTKQVLIAFDNDVAGNEAAVKLAARLAKLGVEAFRVVFPAGMDANGYLCQVAEPESAFQLLLESAVPMGEPVQAVEGAELATHQHQTVPGPETAPSLAAAPAEPGVVVETLPGGELEIGLPGQQWRIRGLAQVKAGSAVMKINAQVIDTASGVMFADSVDMMNARSRAGYARMAASRAGDG